MKIQPYTDTKLHQYADGVTIRWVVGKKDGAPNFAMRVIEVEPGFNTDYHSHDFEHEVYVLNGTAMVRDEGGDEQPVKAGSVVYIGPNEVHGFFNKGDETLRFICVVPHVKGLEPEDA
jgi:quercetin dioxygenase-like cupin family protein